MSSVVFKSVNEMLSGEEDLRGWADENGKRVGANADDMTVGEIDGERYFVKNDLGEAEKAAHIAAAPLLQQFERAPEILYDTETEAVAISELGEDARSPNSARISDQAYSSFAPVDEEQFYEVASQRWILGDSNVYDNILVESVSLEDLMPGNKRDVYLHDFDHAGRHSSRGRKRQFKEAFEYVAEKLDVNFSYRKFREETGHQAQKIDLDEYRNNILEMESKLDSDLYRTVQEHSQRIAGNVQQAAENF